MTEPGDHSALAGDPDGPPRGAIIAAVVVAVAAIVGLLAYAALRQAPADKPVALPLAGAPAPQADSDQCRALLAALPDTMGDFRRATLADPAPPGAAAWLGPTGIDTVVLRCGVERPDDFVVGAPLQMVNAVSWFEASGPSASTWYAVDHGTQATYVALTLPQGSGPTPIQTISELIEKVMPPRPLDPAPAR
ncbi:MULTISPECIES: DUF3515 domain-containing protein [Mycolicibacterium]|uniref:DUF3515 domain-containing protein n=1 Tax=Mycolicibacterium TaxID=1866885 RepID=UPI000FA8CAA7|nr:MULTISPECIES: DUF3515 domain-containing protein [Mycolicibacterium]RUP28849.1 MAG: DUF3515 domain-containing protein [Mycolicibacterium sp.]UCZ62602.1 DUF3515 domain-containing protein [Mycolicibacterium phocaicum]